MHIFSSKLLSIKKNPWKEERSKNCMLDFLGLCLTGLTLDDVKNSTQFNSKWNWRMEYHYTKVKTQANPGLLCTIQAFQKAAKPNPKGKVLGGWAWAKLFHLCRLCNIIDFIFIFIWGVWASLRVSWLIPTGPEVNDQVSFQSLSILATSWLKSKNIREANLLMSSYHY